MKTINDVANIALLMLIFIIYYVLIGMEIFSYKLNFDDK